jgi:hypothetical protein
MTMPITSCFDYSITININLVVVVVQTKQIADTIVVGYLLMCCNSAITGCDDDGIHVVAVYTVRMLPGKRYLSTAI